MISRFFIHRPVFASVISLIILFAGFVAMRNLPIELYPNMTPPLIQVTTTYNGANADVMAGDVSSPLEQQILGVQDMIYMYSQNCSNGTMTLDVYFAIGTNPDMAQVDVQNQINQAQSQLPQAVQQANYFAAALQAFANLGPGEWTANVTALQRAYRHPVPSLVWPSCFPMEPS